MQFDSDMVVWALRGHAKAARVIDRTPARYISVVTYIEVLQGAQSRQEQQAIHRLLSDNGFEVLPLTEDIGHRAAIYIEEYALKAGLRLPDALIAATAAQNQLTLCTGDRKHYRPIKDLELKVFRP